MLKKLLPLLAAVLFFSVPAQAADDGGGTASQSGSTISVMDGVTRIDTGTISTPEAAPVYYPVQVQTMEEGGKLLVVKTFEVPNGTPAQNLVEKELTRDSLRYEVRDILQKELESDPEYKTVSKTISVDTDTDDEQVLLTKLSPVIDYSEDGFEGQLALNPQSLTVEATEAEGYSYTIKDVQDFCGLNRNDPYYVPESVSKNGATLKLANIDWSPMGERYDGNSVPALYTATATYSGEASGSRPTAFKASATYTGEVMRATSGSILYTLVYEPAGAATDESAGTTADNKPLKLIKSIDWSSILYTGGIVILLAGCITILIFLIRSGAFKRRPKPPKPPKAARARRAPKPKRERRQPEPEPDDFYDMDDDENDYEPAYADTEMPNRRKMRIPEAMRQMERPEMGGSTI